MSDDVEPYSVIQSALSDINEVLWDLRRGVNRLSSSH